MKRIKNLFAVLLCNLSISAATITVCRSGCNYQDLQLALNSAQRGDTVRLTAREIFEGNFILPVKSTGAGVITIESSEVASLPASGYRVQATSAQFMPKLVPYDHLSPVLAIGQEEKYVQTVDGSSNTLVYNGKHGYQDNDPISFVLTASVTTNIQPNTIYYVQLVSDTAIKLRSTPAGVPRTVGPSLGNVLVSAPAAVGSNYILRGIEFSAASGRVQEYNLLEMGRIGASHRLGLPDNITLDRVYIHGLQDQNGPRTCIQINARTFTLIDSRIENCNKEGEEGKGIGLVQAPGPGVIKNNYVEGAAINLLFGGDSVRIPRLVSGDGGGISITGNHFYKPLRLRFTSGSGGPSDPAGSCSGEGFQLNTATGKQFKCVNGTWAPAPPCAEGEYYKRNDVSQTCANGACWSCNVSGTYSPSSVFRGSGYGVKNLFEVKSAINLTVRGNIFENNWVNSDQSGVAVWVVSQVSQGNANGWVRGENILFTSNIIKNSSQGIRLASEGPGFGMPNRNVKIVNNILYDIGNTATPSIASNDARPVSFGGPCIDCEFSNNTVVSGTGAGTGVYWDTYFLKRFTFANNVLYNNLYGLLGDRGLPLSYYMPDTLANRNVVIDKSAGATSIQPMLVASKVVGSGVTMFNSPGAKDFSLSSTSPFSARCQSNCQFTGTNGADVGADMTKIQQETSGVVEGVPSGTAQLSARVTSDSTRLLIRYSPPSTLQTCTLIASTSQGFQKIESDVDVRYGWDRNLDSRLGNSFSTNPRTFVLGYYFPLSRNTRYYYRLTCGSAVTSGSATTLR